MMSLFCGRHRFPSLSHWHMPREGGRAAFLCIETISGRGSKGGGGGNIQGYFKLDRWVHQLISIKKCYWALTQTLSCVCCQLYQVSVLVATNRGKEIIYFPIKLEEFFRDTTVVSPLTQCLSSLSLTVWINSFDQSSYDMIYLRNYFIKHYHYIYSLAGYRAVYILTGKVSCRFTSQCGTKLTRQGWDGREGRIDKLSSCFSSLFYLKNSSGLLPLGDRSVKFDGRLTVL